MKPHWLLLLNSLLVSAADVQAGTRIEVDHPFIFWTAEDLRSMKERIESEQWAADAYEAMKADDSRYGDELRDLFQYAVMGDAEAGARQKEYLLRWAEAPHPLGGALYLNILAYDLLYNDLNQSERDKVEQQLRDYIPYSIEPFGLYDSSVFNNEANYARYDAEPEDGEYTRINWLPNIAFPRKISANLAAAALRDEDLIRQTWATHGSVKWYFDSYLCDKGFYSEEFSKMGSTPGALLMYCTAVQNLGLNELGFGYTGAGGATMRGHIETIIDMTWPRVDLGTSRPLYPRLALGDTREGPPFQQPEFATVTGYFADGTGGNELWRAHGAWGADCRGDKKQWDRTVDGWNGKVEKMQGRLWFEWGHKLWPEAGFDYFLAQMRAPGESVYTPRLFFDIDRIDPAHVTPPPALSAVWPERGLVMLRHDQSPRYWESSAPAVIMRLTTEYAHKAHDPLAICGFYAHNRPFYQNPHVNAAYAAGFSKSARSHFTVLVDGHLSGPTENYGTGYNEPLFTDDCFVRKSFAPAVKFVAARTGGRYEGVDETRALFLTADYLLDIFDLKSDQQHKYSWLAHCIGKPEPHNSGAWSSSNDFSWIGVLSEERSCDAGQGSWGVNVVQQHEFSWPVHARLGDHWYDDEYGMQARFLGQSGVTGYIARTPLMEAGSSTIEEKNIVKMTTLLAASEAENAQFVSMHEPYKGSPRVTEFREIVRQADVVAVAIEGDGFIDRLMMRLGDSYDQTMAVADGDDQVTFSNFAFVRITSDSVMVQGVITDLRVAVSGDPVVVANGVTIDDAVSDGAVRLSDITLSATPAEKPMPPSIIMDGSAIRFVSGTGAVNLYRADGRMLHSAVLNQGETVRIPVGRLSAGCYLLRIAHAGGEQLRRFVVK